MRRGSYRLLLPVALCLWPIAGLADEAELDGLPIVAIHFDRADIFDTSDPKTSSRFHRWTNALHIVSKEGFVRSILLFKEGDAYSARAAAESARLLRALGVVNPVEIRARRVDDGVEVTVETRDRWSIELNPEFDVSGSRSSYGVEVEEENLVGWGKTVGVGYESGDERDSVSLRYFDPNMFGSRWRLLVAYADLSDGLSEELRVERPFFSLGTRWSWGVEGRREELVEHLYAESESVVEGDRDGEQVRLWGGVRVGRSARVTRRIVAGWDHRSALYSDWGWVADDAPYPDPADIEVDGPMIAYEQVADRFEVVRGFRAWTVQEDVALGPNFSFSSTLSLPTFGADTKRLLFAGAGHLAHRRGDWLLLGDTWLSGRLDDGTARNVLGGFQLGAAQLGRRGWQVRLLAEASEQLDLGLQLTLGADVGLRGWDPDYFDGTGRALLNVQWRTLIKEEVFGLFSFGALAFCDAGMTWGPRVGPDTDGVRLDTGVGLLFDLAHISRTNLLRIDFALPDDGSGLTITVSTSSILRLPSRLQR